MQGVTVNLLLEKKKKRKEKMQERKEKKDIRNLPKNVHMFYR